MRDKFGKELHEGDEIVYGLCAGDTVDLRYSIVHTAEPDAIRVRSQGGEGPPKILRRPEVIINISAIRRGS